MTNDFTSDIEMSSAADFEVALRGVVLAALENDVDPRGTWMFRADETLTDMEIMVIELAD